jgi:hypothetical protein
MSKTPGDLSSLRNTLASCIIVSPRRRLCDFQVPLHLIAPIGPDDGQIDFAPLAAVFALEPTFQFLDAKVRRQTQSVDRNLLCADMRQPRW